ncbi:hypothetical protein HF263_20645 [Rhizobium leguminosarum]|uniref:hypothetical protein n=1 Tax=Rhizobium leguminosarum TaxID=384 RepID=UPI001C8FADC0|nr:hypothetical protein [Rhizobium leguminosarum]MBY2992923.1 hypothetical protein [Rhizobium leguminosarum]MBY3058470.1 hypothetical protein [Rhizobium leguminosarum]
MTRKPGVYKCSIEGWAAPLRPLKWWGIIQVGAEHRLRYSYFVDDLTHYEVIEEPMLRLRPIHRVEILSFSFNSPIDLLVATGRAVSRNAIVKITTAYKHVVHHAAMDQKLRAEADLADQVALKARLENIKTAIKIHETIKDPELQDRFAQVVHDTFVPLVSPDGPRLKSIDLTDESKY